MGPETNISGNIQEYKGIFEASILKTPGLFFINLIVSLHQPSCQILASQVGLTLLLSFQIGSVGLATLAHCSARITWLDIGSVGLVTSIFSSGESL